MNFHKLYNAFLTLLCILVVSCIARENKIQQPVSKGSIKTEQIFDTLIGKTYQNVKELGAKDGWGEKCIGSTDYCFSIAIFDTNLLVFYEKVIKADLYQEPHYLILSTLNVPRIKGTSVEMTNCRINSNLDNYIVAVVKVEETPTYKTVLNAWRLDKEKETFIPIDVNGVDCLNESYGQ